MAAIPSMPHTDAWRDDLLPDGVWPSQAGTMLCLRPRDLVQMLFAAVLRSRIFHILTTPRALVATDMPRWGRRLDACSLGPMTQLQGKRS